MLAFCLMNKDSYCFFLCWCLIPATHSLSSSLCLSVYVIFLYIYFRAEVPTAGGCLNNCNGRGDCAEGLCRCYSGYSGPDCSDSKSSVLSSRRGTWTVLINSRGRSLLVIFLNMRYEPSKHKRMVLYCSRKTVRLTFHIISVIVLSEIFDGTL